MRLANEQDPNPNEKSGALMEPDEDNTHRPVVLEYRTPSAEPRRETTLATRIVAGIAALLFACSFFGMLSDAVQQNIGLVPPAIAAGIGMTFTLYVAIRGLRRER